MDKQPLIDFIRHNIPNVTVTEQALISIAEHFEVKELARNDYFLKEGEMSCYFFLSEGFMRAFTFDTEGNEVTTYFYPKTGLYLRYRHFFSSRYQPKPYKR